MVYAIKGRIEVFNRYMVAWVDDELIKYYRALLPKAWYVSPPMAKAHITIVRHFERPDKFGWRKYNGEPVDIIYYSGVRFKYPYYFLDADCDRIVQIRRELGLSDHLGLFANEHITIGNVKGVY